MGGDFNIMRNSEEKSGLHIQRGAMFAFSDFINDLSMTDLPLFGGKFTWSNLRESPSSSRIDRLLLSQELVIRWPSLIQQVLPRDRYESSPNILLPSNVKPSNKSFIWRNILAPLNSSDNRMVQNIMYVVGDGKRIQFWSDLWIGENRLKLSFPRVFALACQKSGSIADFGLVVEGVWVWNIPLRRSLFDWEIDLWESF
ncbi:hypothetical protein V6N13_129473 [Hibiscus sabdariffa]